MMHPHTTNDAAPLLRKPDLATDRPQTAAPIWHQIPAELQARRQWVLWRYELGKNSKWTKVPYNAHTAREAKTNAPRTWCTFAEAKAAYLAQRDYFDGIGYVFSKDDPFCGADFDHCLESGQPNIWAAAHIAALRASGAYIEVSVSGNGIHAITRATMAGKGRKTPRGEVYSYGRFFTISGRALEPTPIGDGQAAIDALLADLANGRIMVRDGKPGAGDRAAALAEIPAAEWEEARGLQRTKRDLLIKRSERATEKEETQGFFAVRSLWAELHQRWPHIELYRADGSLDDSQARAVLARTLYGRGFTFPEYVVIMAHHFAAYCLAKWGTKEAWREELAALWANAREKTDYAPKAPGRKKPDVAVSKKPQGRANNHAQTVEHVYALLQEARAGAQALIHTAELASDAGMHRVTLAGILEELRSAGRIETRRNGRYGGLIVSFPDVAVSSKQVAEYCAPVLETANEAPALVEGTSTNSKACVSSEPRESGDSSQLAPLAELAALAAAYLARPADEIGRRCKPNEQTGTLVYRHDVWDFAELVEPYGYTAQQASIAYKTEQHRLADCARAAQDQRRVEQAQRKAAREAEKQAEWARFFAQLKAMPTPDLIAYIHGGCRRELAELARTHDSAAAFDTHKYRTRLKCAKQHLGWRGVALPAKPTKSTPYVPTKPQRKSIVASHRKEQPWELSFISQNEGPPTEIQS